MVGGFSEPSDELMIQQSFHHGLQMPIITASKMQACFSVDHKIAGRT